jgi:hypothetical protein
MVIEKHSSDLGHLVIYHLLPVAVGIVLVYGAIFLMVRLATRRGGKRERGPAEGDGLYRRRRRQERAKKRGRRRY